MLIRPCQSCLRELKEDCRERKRIVDGIRGLGLTSVSFRCEILKATLEPGIRVSAVFQVNVEDGHDPFDGSPFFRTEPEEIKGTLMDAGGGIHKVKVWLDDPVDGDKWFVVRLFPKRLRLLNEPKREVCRTCGRPAGEENREDWFCEECGGPSESLEDLTKEMF